MESGFNKIKYYITHPRKLIIALATKRYIYLPDKLFLKMLFKEKMKRPLNLKNPVTFNEKLQWLKLYDRNPLYTTLVDKYEVKQYISNLIGEEYIIPTLGVWDKFDDIDFDSLPNQFVLKTTHDSGSVVICRDKTAFDFDSAKEKLTNSLRCNFYYCGREWPYKNVKPRIIAEKFISDDGHVPIDYKVYCFNGRPYKVMLCLDRDKDEATKFYSFDFDWQLLRHNKMGMAAPEEFTLPKPKSLDKLYEYAKLLSRGTAFLRVDFYEVGGQLYFGELTFYPSSGFDSAILPETDKLYGDMIKIQKKTFRQKIIMYIGEGVSELRIFHREYSRFKNEAIKTMENFDISGKEKAALLKDWKKSFLKHRVNFNEYYYQYEFYKLSKSERNEYISRSSMQKIYRKNIKPEVRNTFYDKELFLTTFHEYIMRKWMSWDSGNYTEGQKHNLMKILSEQDCIVKPCLGSLGAGVVKIKKLAPNCSFEFICENYLKNGKYLIEECVTAEESIAEFHPASLNTIRVVTFSNNGKCIVFGAFLRMGNNNNVIDNAHANGIFAQIDVETGKIVSDGIDTNNNHYEHHPYTGKKIKGFVIPQWDNIKSFCKKATETIPDIYFAGWDVVVRSDGNIEFIKGNHAPDFDVMQSPLKIGVKKRVLSDLKELEITI